jgi:hypothetical protein
MDVSGLVQPFFFRQTNNVVMCAGGAGVTGAMGPFLVWNIYRLKNNCKQQNLREKNRERKIFVSVKCGSGLIFHSTVTVTVGENAHGVSVTQTASTR